VHVSGTATLTPLAGPPNRLKPGGSGGSAPSRAEPLPEQAVPVTRHSVSRVAVSAKRRTRTGLPSSWNGAALSPRAPCRHDPAEPTGGTAASARHPRESVRRRAASVPPYGEHP